MFQIDVRFVIAKEIVGVLGPEDETEAESIWLFFDDDERNVLATDCVNLFSWETGADVVIDHGRSVFLEQIGALSHDFVDVVGITLGDALHFDVKLVEGFVFDLLQLLALGLRHHLFDSSKVESADRRRVKFD